MLIPGKPCINNNIDRQYIESVFYNVIRVPFYGHLRHTISNQKRENFESWSEMSIKQLKNQSTFPVE